MYNLKISSKAKKSIESYIISYRDAFLNLYSDTGLGYAEEIIKEQYILGADMLRSAFYKAISETLRTHNILGYSYNKESGTYLVTTSIGERRVFLEYIEDTELMIRILQNISIVRR